jgi:arabinogalactan endo-1,4-beta-galactosidase
MMFRSSRFRWPAVSLLLLFLIPLAGPVKGEPFLRGGDVSFLPQVEAGGGVFRLDGQPTDLFDLMAAKGLNMARLRLWHTPQDGHSGLAEVLDLARRADQANLEILLDLHYSDTWADPAHQTKPAAWQGLAYSALCDSVRIYTRDVLVALLDQGTPPAMVQLGNEITPGMLWDEGRVGGAYDTPAQWDQLVGLLQAARNGVSEALPGGLFPPIMIHIDKGGDNWGARWFLENLLDRGFDFDVIGLSFYPWWHGTLADLDTNLDDLATRYEQDLVVVETAYPWTLGWFDDAHNMVGLPEHLLPGYPDTPEGQGAFLAEVLRIVAEAPEGKGKGVLWWEPDWIAAPGFGSAWENLALFDEQGEALPAWDAFGSVAAASLPRLKTGMRLVPNPTQSEVRVALDRPLAGSGRLEVYDLRGRRLAAMTARESLDEFTWRAGDLPAGVYFLRLTTPAGSLTRPVTLVR